MGGALLATHHFYEVTGNAKSYALDATVVSLADEGITYEQIVKDVKKELDAGRTYINLILAPDADKNTLDAIHNGLQEAKYWSINLTLIGCKKIPYGGFMRWDMLKSIALPDVTEIEVNAFSDCTGLQKVVLGNLTKVYDNVGKNGIFYGCRTEDIDLVLSKDQKVMNGGETEEGLTSSSCHPKIFVKEFSYFLMSCHQHCLGVNLLVKRYLNLYGCDCLSQCKHFVYTHLNLCDFRHALQFLVDFQSHKADTYMSLDAFVCKMKHGAYFYL